MKRPKREINGGVTVADLSEALADAQSRILSSSAMSYLKHRGVTPYTAMMYGLGYGIGNPAVTHSTTDAGYKLGLIYRREWLWSESVIYADPVTDPDVLNVRYLPPAYMRHGRGFELSKHPHRTWGDRLSPLGAWRITERTQAVMVVEGLFDMLVGAQFLRRARAYVLQYTQNTEEAIKYYRSALELAPNLAMLHMELGQNLRAAYVYEDAIKEFMLANTLEPGNPEPDYLISRTYGTTGEYEKALQYAETAVKDGPTDPRYRGNWGVMYYRNFKYAEAVKQLTLAIDGGTNEDGFPVRPIALNDAPRIAEFFFTYGLALARTNDCGKALPIAQTLQSRFPAEAESETNAVILEAADSGQSPLDYTVLESGTAFEMQWTIVNTGADPWNKNVAHFVQAGQTGELHSGDDSFAVEDDITNGESVTVNVSAEAA